LELVGLKISDLFFEGFIKITGNKQRFVPIDLAQKYIQLYKDNIRTHINVKKVGDTLF
jgi:integrase/recombinase XerD